MHLQLVKKKMELTNLRRTRIKEINWKVW